MRQRNGKKLISLLDYEAIDLWCKDISLREGRSESLIIEEILLGYRPGMLPKSPSARLNILAWYADDNAVSQLYRSAYGYIAGYARSQQYDPSTALCLVRSLLSQLHGMDDRVSRCDRAGIEYYTSALRDLCRSLAETQATLAGDAATRLAIEAQHAEVMLDQLQHTPQYVQCHQIITILQATWEYSCRYPASYRLLCAQMDILPVPNTPERRLAALKALHEASAHWPD